MYLQRCSKNIFSIRKITTNDQNKILIKSGIPKIVGSTYCTHVYSQSFGGVSWPRFKLRYDLLKSNLNMLFVTKKEQGISPLMSEP